MTKRSKSYRAAAEKVHADVLYTPFEAMKLAKETTVTKFDSTVEVVLRLGVDPRQADQMVRGTVSLPHGTGKTARVLVFAVGPRAQAAIDAGADEVGGDELIEKVSKGYTDFDVAVATPDLMGKVGRLGRILGPRGLMPNPKTGTVTMDVAKAVKEIKGGRIEFRVDKHANLAFVVGKASFTAEQLTENYASVLDEVLRLKPSSSKGRYVLKGSVSTTMGPGIPRDVAKVKDLLEGCAPSRGPRRGARACGPAPHSCPSRACGRSPVSGAGAARLARWGGVGRGAGGAAVVLCGQSCAARVP